MSGIIVNTDGSVSIPMDNDPITEAHIKALERKVDELERRISDVNDAALYDFAKLDGRIERIERLLKHKGGGE